MDVGHDDRGERNVDGGWKERRCSQHPPDFRLLNTHHHPLLAPRATPAHPLTPTPRRHPSTAMWTHVVLLSSRRLLVGTKPHSSLPLNPLFHSLCFSSRSDTRRRSGRRQRGRLRDDYDDHDDYDDDDDNGDNNDDDDGSNNDDENDDNNDKNAGHERTNAREGREQRNGAFLSGNG